MMKLVIEKKKFSINIYIFSSGSISSGWFFTLGLHFWQNQSPWGIFYTHNVSSSVRIQNYNTILKNIP